MPCRRAPGRQKRAPSPLDAKVDWVDAATGRHGRVGIDLVSLSSGRLWNGIRVHQGRNRPGELPEGYLTQHAIGVSVRPASMDMWCPGKRYTDQRIATGKVLVFPAQMPHTIRWSACETIAIVIDPKFVEAVAGCDLDTRRLEIHPAFAAEDNVLANLAAVLVAEVRAGGPNGSLYGQGVGTAVVAHLLRLHGAAPPVVRAEVRALSAGDLRRVTRYIEDQLETDLTLQELADVMGMNVYRFIRSFKQSTGVPPHRYVVQRRVERSKALLADRGLPITEVALRAGFASQSHFSTAFRRLTNITPGRYRRALQ